MISQNDMSFLNLLPGYIVSRADLASRHDIDLKNRQGSWLDGVGEMLFIDAERAFVIPTQELSYVSPEQLRAARLPRLLKLVVSEDAGVTCTISGHIATSWVKTFSKLSVPKDLDTDRHFVKAFAPTHQGPVVGYHAMHMNDGQLSWRSFEQVNGQQLRDLDFLAFEGKISFAATTWPTAEQKTACYVREVAIKAIKENQAINAQFVPAGFAEGHHVANLRGMIKDGQRVYSFLDMAQGSLMQAQLGDKQSKVVKKGIKGVLNHVTGAGSLVSTIVLEDKIVHVGKDERVVCDLALPQHAVLARLVRDSKWIHGVVGKSGLAYVCSMTSPLAPVVTTQLV